MAKSKGLEMRCFLYTVYTYVRLLHCRNYRLAIPEPARYARHMVQWQACLEQKVASRRDRDHIVYFFSAKSDACMFLVIDGNLTCVNH